MMKSEIIEAFEYLKSNPACLSFSEREMIKSFEVYYKKHKQLSERQIRTLRELKKYRERNAQHLY